MATFKKTQFGGGYVSTEAANEELNRLRRVGQYTEAIFPKRTGGGGGGGGYGNSSKVTTALWNEYKNTFDVWMGDLAKDLQELDQSYNMGLLNGAQHDSRILEVFDYYKEKVVDVLLSEDNELLRAKSESAPTTVSDWLESSQKAFDTIKAEYGALEEPKKFRSDQTLESIESQNDLLERKQFFNYVETKDQEGNVYKDVVGYTYDDVVVGQDGKVNKNIAQSDSIVVDVWGANGYEQVPLSKMEDDNYVFDKDPYTQGYTFYQAESQESEEEKNLPQYARTGKKDKFVYLKGENNTPVKVRVEETEQGKTYYYTKDQVSGAYTDGFSEPQKLGANQTMASLSGVPFSSWDAFPAKDVAKQLWATTSKFPSDGSWVNGRDGKVYKYENGQLREAKGAVLESYRREGQFDESITKQVPGAFFNPELFGPKLHSFDIENQNIMLDKESPEGISQNLQPLQRQLQDQAQSFATGQPTPSEQNVQTDQVRQFLGSFMAPRLQDVRQSFNQPTGPFLQPQTQEVPKPEEQSSVQGIKRAYIPSMAKGLFERFL